MLNNNIAEIIPNPIYRIMFAIFVFLLSVYIIKIAKQVLLKYLSPRLEHNKSIYVLIYKILITSLSFISFIITLSILVPNFSATNIINLLGITSVAIGFAFKDILQNFLSGILLLIEHPFNIGDYIISDKFEGSVRDIKIRATILKTKAGEKVVIPNSKLFTSPIVVNNAYILNRISVALDIPAAQDIDLIIRLITNIFEQSKTSNKNTKPRIEIVEIIDKKIKLKLTWWYNNKDVRPEQTSHEILLAINKSFLQNDIY